MPHICLEHDEKDKIHGRLTKAFNGMMSALFRQQGATLDINILASDEAQRFINTHASTLDHSFLSVKMTDAMRRRLRRSTYIFSSIKTFHELNEAFPSLLDENGDRKPFEQFLNDVQKIDKTYNRHYLEAEYNFVNASAEMAAKWETYAEDGDRYNLQYRTAGDDKVRPEHAALNGVTLPQSDPFWETYYPPNGWNCRCTVVQVRKSKYATTPREEAMARGEEALQSDTKGIFRFNSGKQEKAIPDYNAYTIKRCRDCDVAQGKIILDFQPSNQLCAACKLVHECYGDKSKSAQAVLRKHYLREMEPLVNTKVAVNGNGHPISVGFSKFGNKHLYSDTFRRSQVLEKDDLANLDKLLASATFVKKAELSKPRNNDKIKRFYYYKATLHGKTVYLNVAETDVVKKRGKIAHDRFLYSVTDNIK